MTASLYQRGSDVTELDVAAGEAISWEGTLMRPVSQIETENEMARGDEPLDALRQWLPR